MAESTFYTPAEGDGRTAGSGTTAGAARLSNGAQAVTSENVPYIGITDDGKGTYYCHRIHLPFDTSSLPDGATITAATLYIYGQNGQDTTVHAVQGGQASTSTLVDSDHQSVGQTSFGSADLIWNGAWRSITLDASGRAAISKTGWTKLALRTAYDMTGSGNTTFVGVGSADSVGVQPYLVVEYTEAGTQYDQSVAASAAVAASVAKSTKKAVAVAAQVKFTSRGGGE